jgi:rhodanese-related sulfurtransferase
MMKILGMSAAVILLCVGLARAAESTEGFKIIHVQDLADLLARQPTSTWIYDANPSRVRDKEGIIPGAKLLSSSRSYDLRELPQAKDSKLVFYCHNTYWMASHEAARRAVEAGYSEVSVMADGISGWVAAGKPTAKP